MMKHLINKENYIYYNIYYNKFSFHNRFLICIKHIFKTYILNK